MDIEWMERCNLHVACPGWLLNLWGQWLQDLKIERDKWYNHYSIINKVSGYENEAYRLP